jgi:hypothetical protein
VKLVKVFVKSDFLEPGIVLVDLPGNLDSNAARSAIAEEYSKDLSVSCIVAGVTRGISEKNVSALLFCTITIRVKFLMSKHFGDLQQFGSISNETRRKSFSRSSPNEIYNLMDCMTQVHSALSCQRLTKNLILANT